MDRWTTQTITLKSAFLLTVLLLLLTPTGSLPAADEPDEAGAETETQAAKPRKKRHILPIPIIITEPAIGEGLGLAITWFHDDKPGAVNPDDDPGDGENLRLASAEAVSEPTAGRKPPPVVSAIFGAYTNSGTWAAGIGHSNNWRRDSIRYSGALAAAHINSSIYINNLPVAFELNGGLIYQDFRFRLKSSRFFLGLAWNYVDADTTIGIDLQSEKSGELFSSDISNSGLAGRLVFENRDNTQMPQKGQLVEATLYRFDEAFGGDYNYWNAKFKALSFYPLHEKFVLGLRLEAVAIDGRAPFFGYPWVTLRGVPALRYQGNRTAVVEIEGRYRLAERWMVTAYTGRGWAGSDLLIFDNDDSIYNFGVGAKFKAFHEKDVWVGIDIARGPEESAWYVQVGNAW